MNRLLFLYLVGLAATSATASVFFSLDIGSLKDGSGNPLTGEGLLYLVVSTADDEFQPPVAGQVVPTASDDRIVASWDLKDVGSVSELMLLSGEVEYGADWSEGDPLGVIWFPSLTAADISPENGEPFGFYRNFMTDGTGDAWLMPTDGSLLHSLKFFTSDANLLVNGGDVPSFVGTAGFSVGSPAGAAQAPTSVATSEVTPRMPTFSWTGASALGGGYIVERRLAGETEWTTVGFPSPSATSFSDSSTGRGKNYEYRLTAINGYASAMSSAAGIETLRSNIINISTRGLLGSGDESMIVGFGFEGTGDATILARTVGPKLVDFGIANFSPDPNATLYRKLPGVDQETIDGNDDWGDIAPQQIVDITGLLGAFALDDGSTDAALVATVAPTGVYSVVSDDPAEEVGVAIVEVYDAMASDNPNAADYRFVNLSTRGFVGQGDNIMIGGLVVNGQVGTQLLIRGIGPRLADFAVNGTLVNPKLIIRNAETLEILYENDDWEDDDAALVAATAQSVGAFELVEGSSDAAVLVDLPRGRYSIELLGADGGTGVSLLEFYQVDDQDT